MPAAIRPPVSGLWNHPSGLYVLFLTEMWERFSFYGMRALLVFYLTKHFLLSDQVSLGIYGAYVALGYATPVIGGLLADRYLGRRLAVTIGAVMMCLGHFGMAFEGAGSHLVEGSSVVIHDAAALQTFYFSLALIAVGVGFLKPNIATIVSDLYAPEDPRRASGYTLFQMGIMLGAALSAGVCGYLGEQFGWKYGFGAAGLGMLAGLLVFLFGQRTLNGVAEPPSRERLMTPVLGPCSPFHLILLGAMLTVLVFWGLLQQTHWVGRLLGSFSAVVVAILLFISLFRSTPLERDRMLVLLALQLALMAFAILFEQAGGALNLFADRHVQRSLGGWEVKASQLQSIVPMTIVCCAPFFAWLWPALAARGRDPRTPTKYSLTMFFMGAGFGLLNLAVHSMAVEGRIALHWLIVAYILFGLADLLIVSVCYATVTLLSLPRIVGMMMGTSMLAISAANYIAPQIALLAGVGGKAASQQGLSPIASLMAYDALFSWLTGASFASAFLLLITGPFLSRRMHGIH